ncbi:30S ribosomal protein S14 [archaeon]|jgi:small subunit ribosomal protein S14|nr:30S ribosomal protein S14 [archaeon]MBT6824008.1 30S ribosomal protein S14 [archaeon]MBT7107241.1 30S ribosomal protein S14 [archaeon]MBT7297162.1 30S ribosomal protein S14 [archaeon]
MTAKNYEKVFKQLEKKPVKLKKFIKHNKPKERSCGEALRRCGICGRRGAHIRKYGLGLCRQCFRDVAKNLGFKKYS